MTIDILPIVTGAQHFVEVVLDGHEMKRHGPFCSAAEAEAMAHRLAAVCRLFHIVPAPAKRQP